MTGKAFWQKNAQRLEPRRWVKDWNERWPTSHFHVDWKWMMVFIFLGKLKTVSLVSLFSKFGKMDRGWCSRGPLPEPGTDEEQSMGGERKMHPPLGWKVCPSATFDVNRRPTNDPWRWPYPACEGTGRTKPTILSPWMYYSWYPQPLLDAHSNKSTETHTDWYKLTANLGIFLD